MAKSSNLREFQESILLKLKQAVEQGGAVTTSRLGVTVGEKKLLINLSDVREVLPMPSVQAVPLTQPWFLGVANVRGNLYNVTDLAHFIKLTPTQKSANNRIVLLSSEVTTQAALMIESLVGLRNIDTMQVKTLAHADQSNVDGSHFIKQAYEDADGNEWLEIDINALVQDKVFIQPTLA
ncbi:MAG: chemotaxis protein CheW [Pseudomonadota bacterium]